MDSPKRKQLKRNDYLRHKMFRKIRKQQKAELEQQKKAAEKELKRRLRVTPIRKFEGGKNVDGRDTEEVRPPIVPFNQREEVIITPDREYNKYLNTLPDNQRFTPNEEYDSYLYWLLNGKPRNFKEAYERGMFNYDHSDNSYHGNSIAYDDNGVGYFIKPKTHDTVKYELDWYNKSLVTEEGGHQRPMNKEEKAFHDDFKSKYDLIDDPNRPNYYRYQPIKKFEGGKDVLDYLDEYAEEYEPYAAGLALGSDAVALGTAATGVGAPIGATIATVGNIPNLAIDVYQAARNWYKYGSGDNDNLVTPIISTGEAILDTAGISSALKGISYLKDRAIANEAARIFEREFASRLGRRILLRKRGMSDEEIAGYLAQKATNAALNSKELAQTKKKETSKQNRRNAVAKPVIRATSNIATNFVAPQYFDAQNNYKPVWQRN